MMVLEGIQLVDCGEDGANNGLGSVEKSKTFDMLSAFYFDMEALHKT